MSARYVRVDGVAVRLDGAGGGPSLYVSEVLADTPSAYWPFAETSGSMFEDISGAGKHLTITLAPTVYAVGFAEGALLPAGPFTAEISEAIPDNMTDGDWSLEAWLRITADVGNALPLYIGNSGSNGAGLFISAPSSGDAGRRLQCLQGGVGFAQGDDLTLGDLHHIVITASGTTRLFYLNGVEVADGTLGSPAAASALTKIHSTSSVMAIGHVAIYEQALDPVRAAAHFEAAGA